MSDPLEGVITIASPAGGVGRTSLALGIASILANEGSRVLVVDLDGSSGASILLGQEPDASRKGITEALSRPDDSLACVSQTDYPGLSVLINDVVSAKEAAFEAALKSRRSLFRLLESLRSWYHTIVVDVPSGTGWTARSAFEASDEVLVCLSCEPLAVRLLPGLLEAISESRDLESLRPGFAGICLNRVETSAPFFEQVLAQLESTFGPLVLETAVPSDPWFVEAASRAMPLPCLLPEAMGAMAIARLLEEIRVRLSRQ